MTGRVIGSISLGLVASIIAAVVLLRPAPESMPVTSLVAADLLQGLPQKDASGIDTSHLAKGVVPPTNKWFSGIALQSEPKAVFPTPLSFTPTASTFRIDLPQVETTEKSILSVPSVPTTVTIADADHYLITRYDEISVDLTYYKSDSTPLATVTIAAGLPYVYYYGLNASRVTIAAPELRQTDATSLEAQSQQTTLQAAAFDAATMQQDNGIYSSSVPKNGLLSFYGLSSTQSGDPLKENASARLLNSKVNYEKQGSGFKTTIALTTSNNRPTLYGLLPHQKSNSPTTYTAATLYGTQRFSEGLSAAFTTPAIPVTDSLDISRINPEQRQLLVTQLRHDINATQMTAEDTYFGGKQMYRSAQLLQLARQLNEATIASSIQTKLHNELAAWLKPADGRAKKAFYYDTKIQGIVGQTPSFGSDEFNDHHFHYGYFIYAASILVQYDDEFKSQYRPMIDLLVADIANYKIDEDLPLRRTFDPYFGHSWASGSSPFNDGNNQESASEAMNAWIGTSLWAKQTSNETLQTQADWMLSNETEATKSYWLGYDQSQAPYNQSFLHTISPLNWGGKRDYATFFSGEPSAMLGILLIPMNPTMVTFGSLDQRIDTVVKEAFPTPESDNAQFADYILMLNSLADDTIKLDRAKSLSDDVIDDANSRSYLYAWILSQK